MTTALTGPSTDWLDRMDDLVADAPKPVNVILEPDWISRMDDLAFPEGKSPTDKANKVYWNMVLERQPTIDFSSQSDDELREQILGGSQDRWWLHPGTFIAGIPRGAANTTIAALAGTAQLAGEAANLVGIDNDVVEWARGIQEAAQEGVESVLPPKPGTEGSIVRAVSEGLGSTVPAVAGALAAGIPGLMAFGATAAYSNTYQNARNLGATPADAQLYARFSAVVGGVTEPAGAIMPAIQILKKVNKATGGSLLRTLLKSGAREAVQETIQEIPDETARQAYLENRTMMDAIAALAEAGLIGGIVGVLLPGIVMIAKASLAERPSLEVEPSPTTDELTVGEVERGPGAVEPTFDASTVQPGETIITDYGNEALLEDYRQRVEAGQKDPTPNAQTFKDIGLPEMTRKQRAEYIARLLTEETEGAVEQAQVGPQPTQQAEPGAPTPPTPEAPLPPATPGAQAQPSADPQQPAAVIAPPDGGNSATSIKNAVVDDEREKRGLRPAMEPARRSFGAVWDEAMRSIEEDPTRQDALIRELRDKPRPVFDHEDAMLLHRQVALQNEYDKVLARLDESQKSEDQTAIVELQSQEELLSQELLELYDINKAVGTATSRGLNARKMLASDDFTLVRMIAQKRKALGVDQLTEESTNAVKEENRKLADLERRLNEHVVRIEELEREAAIAEAMKKVMVASVAKRPKRSVAAKVAIEDAWKGFESQLAGKLFANPLDPELLAAAAKLAGAYVKAGVAQFQDFFDAVVDRIGRAKAEKASDILNQAWSLAITEEKPRAGKAAESLEDISRYVRELAEFFVASGITERAALVEAVHAELSNVIPNITLRETMDAISGYGQFKPLNMDEIKVRLRDIKGQLQQVAKLEDMEAGQAPLKTGIQRREPSNLERRLIQQVNEMKKRGGFEVTDPASQLRSALDAIKTRLKNQIVDLEQQIESRQRIIKDRKTPPSDEETKRLTQRRDALREQFDEIFGRRGLTDEQRIKNATAALERSIEDYKRRIVKGDIEPRPRGIKTPKTAGLEALRVRRDALKAELQHLRDLLNPKMTPEERALSALKASLRRRTADYQDRLARADFEPRKRKETKEDKEAEDLRFQFEKAKADFMRGLEADRRAKRTLVRKAGDVVLEGNNLTRAVITSFDISAIKRQAAPALYSRPILAIRAIKDMVVALKSDAGLSKVNNEIANRKNAPLYKRGKLSLLELNAKLSKQEESYRGYWHQRIPGVTHSARAFVGFLNRFRVDLFDMMISSIAAPDGTVTEDQIKSVARWVNDFTGRATFGRFESVAEAAAVPFFSPRFVASRFRVVLGMPLLQGKGARLAIAREYARSLAGATAYYGTMVAFLTSMFGLPGDDKKWNISLNPWSSDFLKVRIGNTRIDPLGGLQQVTVFLWRTITQKKATIAGDIYSLRGDVPFGRDDYADVLFRFIRTKFAPVPGAVLDYLSGTNVVGEPVTPGTLAASLTVPLALRDIYDAMIDLGIPGGAAAGILALFGDSVYTFGDRYGDATDVVRYSRPRS